MPMMDQSRRVGQGRVGFRYCSRCGLHVGCEDRETGWIQKKDLVVYGRTINLWQAIELKGFPPSMEYVADVELWDNSVGMNETQLRPVPVKLNLIFAPKLVVNVAVAPRGRTPAGIIHDG